MTMNKTVLLSSLSGALLLCAMAPDAFAKDRKFEFAPKRFVGTFPDAKDSTTQKAGEEEPSLADQLDALPELKSKDPSVYLKRAQIFLKHKLYKRALKDINKCLELNPNNWNAKYLGAYIYQLQGRDEEAITRYRHLLSVKPDNILAHINLGTLLRKKHQYKLAESHYRKAVGINYYSLKAHYNLANVLVDQQKSEEALKELKVCVKLDPTNARVHNNLGVLYQKRNYLEEAEEEFLRAITLEPANQTFVTNLKLLRGHKPTHQVQADAADLL